MNKKVSIVAVLLLTMVCAVVLTACGGYNSSYSAFGMVTTQTPTHGAIAFWTFKGTYVFDLQCGEGDFLAYTATLKEGEATVYYDCEGTKQVLFAIKAGESVEAANAMPKGKLYVIVESNGTIKTGDFRFTVQAMD